MSENIPIAELKYIAGFVDGDASMGIYTQTVRIAFYQSRTAGVPPVLSYVQQRFGGTPRVARVTTATVRTSWSLVYHGDVARKIIRMIHPYLIIKRPQAELIMQYQRGCTRSIREGLEAQLLQARQLVSLNAVTIDQQLICAEYVAGLYDAEGYVGVAVKTPLASLAQLSCVNLLIIMQTMLHEAGIHASVKGRLLNVYGNYVFAFLQPLRPYLIQKRDQVELIFQFQWAFTQRHRGNQQVDCIRRHVNTQLKALKQT
jgi:hypothetical protein